jgi:hypothetical protein
MDRLQADERSHGSDRGLGAGDLSSVEEGEHVDPVCAREDAGGE